MDTEGKAMRELLRLLMEAVSRWENASGPEEAFLAGDSMMEYARALETSLSEGKESA